ncbi:unnamed protein product [Onchocerca ochengi]|uniref:BHLH domain-containing protein n=1 Tax=Onchocerca ochengi TaxID=42157 RepID=A0A182ET13_ONCOC|nr:unnamed protein product [Onchocerca ochengi]VDM95561.1 unnamed protein product [Onchocerca ochengi]
MQEQISDKNSKAYQRLNCERLKKRIQRQMKKANTSNLLNVMLKDLCVEISSEGGLGHLTIDLKLHLDQAWKMTRAREVSLSLGSSLSGSDSDESSNDSISRSYDKKNDRKMRKTKRNGMIMDEPNKRRRKDSNDMENREKRTNNEESGQVGRDGSTNRSKHRRND